MKKLTVILLVALLLCCTACTQRFADPPSSSAPTEQTKPEAAPNTASVSEEEPSSQPDEQISTPAPSQSTKEAVFFLPGMNAQGTEVVFDVPDSWTVEVDKLIINGNIVAKFDVALQCDDAIAYLESTDSEFADAEAVSDLKALGLEGRCYHYLVQNDDGTSVDELRYVVCVGGRAVYVTTPMFGADSAIQSEDFEACLATVKVTG